MQHSADHPARRFVERFKNSSGKPWKDVYPMADAKACRRETVFLRSGIGRFANRTAEGDDLSRRSKFHVGKLNILIEQKPDGVTDN
ncbi:hypothetical protein X801_01666, partial [Opisthorchis viverrini]